MRAQQRGRGACKKYETRLVRNEHEYRLHINLFSLLRGQRSPPLLRNKFKRNHAFYSQRYFAATTGSSIKLCAPGA